MNHTQHSAYIRAIRFDNSIPIESEAVELWLKDLENPFRWTLRPILQLFFAVLLHLIWFLKRLPLPQFRAHKLLQKVICWFCAYFVSREANLLILRHYATESNLLNFLISNTKNRHVAPLELYPESIQDLLENSFVDHDQELFRTFEELGHWDSKDNKNKSKQLNWDHWKVVDSSQFKFKKRVTQIFDFETSHALFMCLFCLLLTREEYRDAINGFNLDQSIAIRIGHIIGESDLGELAYNKFPHYLVGPWNLSQRFLMHGFFTEYLYAKLEGYRNVRD